MSEMVVQRDRGAAHVRDVDEVTVHVLVADGAHRIRAIRLESELSESAMKEHSVEQAGYCFVNLTSFHLQRERLRSGVHVAGDG